MPLILKIIFAVWILSALAILVLTARAVDYNPDWDDLTQEQEKKNELPADDI